MFSSFNYTCFFPCRESSLCAHQGSNRPFRQNPDHRSREKSETGGSNRANNSSREQAKAGSTNVARVGGPIWFMKKSWRVDDTRKSNNLAALQWQRGRLINMCQYTGENYLGKLNSKTRLVAKREETGRLPK